MRAPTSDHEESPFIMKNKGTNYAYQIWMKIQHVIDEDLTYTT